MFARVTIGILSSLLLVQGCTARRPATYEPQAARAAIAAGLPVGWSKEDPSKGQTDLTGAYFRHPRADSFLLRGPQPGSITWWDRQGRQHTEVVGRECLWVWLVPGPFKPTFPSFFDPGAPPRPVRVCASTGLDVYAMVQRNDDAEDKERLHEIKSAASGIYGDEVCPSWTTWRKDIAAAVAK